MGNFVNGQKDGLGKLQGPRENSQGFNKTRPMFFESDSDNRLEKCLLI